MTEQLTRSPLHENLPSWGVLLLESHHDVGFSMQPRTHDFLKVLYVLQGAGCLAYTDSRDSFEIGDCLIVPPGVPNWIEDDPMAASSLYICCISKTLLDFDRDLVLRFPVGKLKSDSHVANRVASHMRRLAYAQARAGEGRPLRMVSEAMRLLQVISDQLAWQRAKPALKPKPRRPVNPSRKKSSAKFLHDRLSDSEASLIERYTLKLDERFFEATTIDDAAASVGLSRRAFTRVFSLHTGETWLQYVRRLAIEHASRLLCETQRPIVTIAFECGFNDLSTFYRQFKARTKMSPADYRRQHLERSPTPGKSVMKP